MAETEPFESYPFIGSKLPESFRTNSYIVFGINGEKKKLDAPNASLAIKHSGVKNPVRVERFDPMSKPLIELYMFDEGSNNPEISGEAL